MIRLLFLAGIVSLAPLAARSQAKPVTVKTDSDILWAGADRAGDLFVVLASGDVEKYDKAGKLIGTHHLELPPTLLDPLDGVQSFYFQRAGNYYGNISADMTRLKTQVVDPSFAVRPWLVCPALHELWILDSADFSIKKTGMQSSMISLEATLNHLPQKKISDYVHLREYQNYLFLLDRSAGIHMFNGLGKRIKTIGEKNLPYFNFLGEEIYFVVGQEIILIDLYTNEKRSLPLDKSYHFVLLTEDRQYSITDRSIIISTFIPG
ncbi:MAG: hypothetical protein SH819_09105 [Cytophagales bacterium]|nr:hypothetical protein [Cytophagales bacterium]